MQHCVISHSLNLYLGFSNLWPDPRPSSPEALLRTLVYIIKMHNTLNHSVHCSAVVLSFTESMHGRWFVHQLTWYSASLVVPVVQCHWQKLNNFLQLQPERPVRFKGLSSFNSTHVQIVGGATCTCTHSFSGFSAACHSRLCVTVLPVLL